MQSNDFNMAVKRAPDSLPFSADSLIFWSTGKAAKKKKYFFSVGKTKTISDSQSQYLKKKNILHSKHKRKTRDL